MNRSTVEGRRSKEVAAAAEAVRARLGGLRPGVAIVLGSGLGAMAEAVDAELTLSYRDIPHAVASAVTGHSGRLVAGRFSRVPVVVFQGRVHYYEGHSIDEVTFLARVAGRLGIETAVVTNAAGGVNTNAPSEESESVAPELGNDCTPTVMPSPSKSNA